MYLSSHAYVHHGHSAGTALKCVFVRCSCPPKAPYVLVTWSKAQGPIPLGLNWLEMGPQEFSRELLDPE